MVAPVSSKNSNSGKIASDFWVGIFNGTLRGLYEFEPSLVVPPRVFIGSVIPTSKKSQ